MIEFALVLILLVMLLVGTVSAAVAYGRNSAIHNAAREASRFAATLPEVDSNFTDVVVVAQNAATGDLEPTAPGYYVCVAYVKEIGSASSNSRHTDGSPPSLPADNTCFDDGRPDGEGRVQVITGRTSELSAVLFSVDLNLRGEAAARYERES